MSDAMQKLEARAAQTGRRLRDAVELGEQVREALQRIVTMLRIDDHDAADDELYEAYLADERAALAEGL